MSLAQIGNLAKFVKPLVKPAMGAAGSVAIGGGASTLYRSATGEEMPVPLQAAAYGLGGLGSMGKLGRTVTRMTPNLAMSGAAVQLMDNAQKRNFGVSLMDPKGVQAATKKQMTDTLRGLAGNPDVERILASLGVQARPLAKGGFQFTSMHGSGSNVHDQGVRLARAYRAKYHGSS